LVLNPHGSNAGNGVQSVISGRHAIANLGYGMHCTMGAFTSTAVSAWAD